MKNIIFAFAIAITVMGCSTYHSQSFYEISKIEVDLESNNFKVRKLGVQGTGECAYLFGTSSSNGSARGIPLGNMDLQSQAMSELHKNWDGKGSCFFHNTNVEWTSYGIEGIYIVYQCTITTDIYEFDREYIDYAKRIFR